MAQSRKKGQGRSNGRGAKEKATGRRGRPVSDAEYDVVSVLYHALQGAETLEMYLEDAEEEGDRRVRDFLRESLEANRRVAERGRAVLSRMLSGPAEEEE